MNLICGECQEDIELMGIEDPLTVCTGCGTIEGRTYEITDEEWEKLRG